MAQTTELSSLFILRAFAPWNQSQLEKEETKFKLKLVENFVG